MLAVICVYCFITSLPELLENIPRSDILSPDERNCREGMQKTSLYRADSILDHHTQAIHCAAAHSEPHRQNKEFGTQRAAHTWRFYGNTNTIPPSHTGTGENPSTSPRDGVIVAMGLVGSSWNPPIMNCASDEVLSIFRLGRFMFCAR